MICCHNDHNKVFLALLGLHQYSSFSCLLSTSGSIYVKLWLLVHAPSFLWMENNKPQQELLPLLVHILLLVLHHHYSALLYLPPFGNMRPAVHYIHPTPRPREPVFQPYPKRPQMFIPNIHKETPSVHSSQTPRETWYSLSSCILGQFSCPPCCLMSILFLFLLVLSQHGEER